MQYQKDPIYLLYPILNENKFILRLSIIENNDCYSSVSSALISLHYLFNSDISFTIW